MWPSVTYRLENDVCLLFESLPLLHLRSLTGSRQLSYACAYLSSCGTSHLPLTRVLTYLFLVASSRRVQCHLDQVSNTWVPTLPPVVIYGFLPQVPFVRKSVLFFLWLSSQFHVLRDSAGRGFLLFHRTMLRVALAVFLGGFLRISLANLPFVPSHVLRGYCGVWDCARGCLIIR